MSYVYLDYAAATPLDKRVLKAMQPHLSERFANPSSLHSAGRDQRKALEGARASVAKALGAKPAEIIFTSGSTEAANIAIRGVAAVHPNLRAVASAVEHEAVLRAIDSLGALGGTIAVGADAAVSREVARAAIDDTTVLVCVQYANNEVGTIQPIVKLSALVADIRADRQQRGISTPLYVYCDAAQAGLLNLQVSRLGVDLMSMGGSKLYGPSGSGMLYVRSGVELAPYLFGGGQESGLRSGTENVAAAVGFAAALDLIQADRAKEAKRQKNLMEMLGKGMANIEGIRRNGGTNGLAGTLNLTIEGIDGETAVAYLDKKGFAVATGSACTAANQDPSHVLLAMGLSRTAAESSLRITIGRETSAEQVRDFAATLRQQIAHLRTMSQNA